MIQAKYASFLVDLIVKFICKTVSNMLTLGDTSSLVLQYDKDLDHRIPQHTFY